MLWCLPGVGPAGGGGSQVVLEVLGRLGGGQVKLKGVRLELGEVEAAVTAAGGGRLVSAAVASVVAGNRLVVWVVPRPEAGSTAGWVASGAEAIVRLHCGRCLLPAVQPLQYCPVESLPLTLSGKLDRAALPTAVPAPKPPLAGAAAAAGGGVLSAAEQWVAAAWEEVLGLGAGSVGPADSFFELGGHSASAVAVCRILQDKAAAEEVAAGKTAAADWSLHDIRVRYCALFRKPRLRDYARFLEWAAIGAPTRSAADAAAFGAKQAAAGCRDYKAAGGVTDRGGGEEGEEGEEDPEAVLAAMEAALPQTEDERALLADALTAAAGWTAEHLPDKGTASTTASSTSTSSSEAVVVAALEYGAPPDGVATRKARAVSPLMLSAAAGRPEAVRLLLSAGAAVILAIADTLQSAEHSDSSAG